MSSSKNLYGKYPGGNRYHTDQVPLDFSLRNTKSYNEKGQGYCWQKGSKVDMTKRQATFQPFFRALGPQNVKPCLIVALKPKIVSEERGIIDVKTPTDTRIRAEMKLYDKRVNVYYDPKAYASHDVCVQMLKDFDAQTSNQGDRVLGMDNWDCQTTEEYQSLAKRRGVKLVYSPSDCTDLCAVTDYGLGNTSKGFMVDEFRQEFESRLEHWCGSEDDPSRKTITASERRILFTKWVANAWEKMKNERQEQITGAFKACGMFNATDGSENSLIKLPRYNKEYVVEPMTDSEEESSSEDEKLV